MPRTPRILALTTLLVAASFGSAHALSSLDLTETQGYNVITFGDANLRNSDTEGRMAIGGNAQFNSYSVGTLASNPSPLDPSFVVGGNLTAGHGQVYNGSIYVGGTYAGPGYSLNSAPGSVTASSLGGGVPFDFDAVELSLTAKSASYGAEASTGTALLQWSTLTLTGTDEEINIFNITAADLASASTPTINTPASAQVLINISGNSADFSNKGIDGTFTRTNTLFNFTQATSLLMSGISIEGSILAPLADVSFISGQMNGQLIAKSFAGTAWSTGEMHESPFANPATPSAPVLDAGSTLWLLVGTTLGLLVAARSRTPRRA